MEKLTAFTIFKVKDPSDDPKKPTHTISMKIGDKYEYIGRCWTKDGNNGKFLSCQLDKPYEQKSGYHIDIDLPEAKEPIIGLDGRDLTNQAF